MTSSIDPEVNVPHPNTNRIILALFLVQSLTGAATIATAAVAALLGAEISGRDALAGLPSAVILFAGAPAAVIWGLLWQWWRHPSGFGPGITPG